MMATMTIRDGVSPGGATCAPPLRRFDDARARLLGRAPFSAAAVLELDDVALLQLAGINNDHALRQLYGRYSTLVYSLALRMLRSQAQAEETLQDTFIRVWRAAATYDPARGAVDTWIASIARNSALSNLRRLRWIARHEEVEQIGPEAGEQSDPEAVAWRHARRDMVRRAVDSLPRNQRAMIVLTYYHGLTHAEIAERTGIPLGTVKSRLRLALRRLSALLEPVLEGTSDAPAQEARR